MTHFLRWIDVTGESHTVYGKAEAVRVLAAALKDSERLSLTWGPEIGERFPEILNLGKLPKREDKP
jgi:hypothetical protein